MLGDTIRKASIASKMKRGSARVLKVLGSRIHAAWGNGDWGTPGAKNDLVRALKGEVRIWRSPSLMYRGDPRRQGG